MKPRSGCGSSIKIILTHILLSAKAMRRYSNFIRRYTSNAKPSCNDANQDDHSLIRRFAALVNPSVLPSTRRFAKSATSYNNVEIAKLQVRANDPSSKDVQSKFPV
jgi:hypothetical protein